MDELISFALNLGFDLSPSTPDGVIHRQDRQGKNSGWFIYHKGHTHDSSKEFYCATFGEWVSGEKWNFKSSKIKFSKDDNDFIKEQQAKAKAMADIEKRKIQEEAAAKCNTEFLALTDSQAESAYLKRKMVGSKYKAKLDSAGDLHVPMYDINGKIWGIQRIIGEGQVKLFQKGQRKKETFHAIPSLSTVQQSDKIFIAEGFATAASIYEATGTPTVVAFDAGNLESVYRILKNKNIVVCADDDQFKGTNAGRKYGDDLSSKYGANVIYPKFKDISTKPTDFNDLYILEGPHEVRRQLADVDFKPTNKVTFLGFSGSNYYYYTTRKKQVTCLKPKDHTPAGLAELMTTDEFLLEDRFVVGDEDKGFRVDYTKVANEYISCNQAVGVFKPDRIQGAGVWKENGKLVLNVGSKLHVDGKIKEFGDIKTDSIFTNSRVISPPSNQVATVSQMSELATALEKLNFKNKAIDVRLFLGWLMTAPLCGALPWRPHLWLTASSGTGKSYIFEHIVGEILKGRCHKFLGSETTSAGVRQNVGCDAIPVMFDELETDDRDSADRVKRVVELIRIASTESSAKVAKGTISGNALNYTVRFSAFVSSIRTGLDKLQDRNRFVVLELVKSEVDNFSGPNGVQATFQRIITPEFTASMFARSMHQYDAIIKNRNLFYPLISERTQNPRLADQYSVLIAGYCAAIMDGPISYDDATSLINLDTFGVEKEAIDLKGSDEDDCLNWLLSSNIKHNNKDFTVGELVRSHLEMKPASQQDMTEVYRNNSEFQATLMMRGLKVDKEGFLSIQYRHPELFKIFKDTKWCVGWAPTLLRLKWSGSTTSWINGRAVRTVRCLIGFESND